MKTTPDTSRPPETLSEAVVYFSDEAKAHALVAKMRWPDGKQVCPSCGSLNSHYWLATRRIYTCREKECRKQFSVKVGTIFEDSPLPLSKWLTALWLLTNCKNGVSSYEVARALHVTQKSAWFMLHRLRLALQPESSGPMGGTLEMDETFLGGSAQNMHAGRRKRVMGSHGHSKGKVSVLGLLRRTEYGPSRVVCKVTHGPATAKEAHALMAKHAPEGACVNTDSAMAFARFSEKYNHGIVDHLAKEYVKGSVHTQGIENFWSLLKRTIKGTYVCPAPFHVFRYLDEQAFRFNQREMTDGERVRIALGSVNHKRLTYKALTGHGADRRTA